MQSYIHIDDLAEVFIGPFASRSAAQQHIDEVIVPRGDSAKMSIISAKKFASIQDVIILLSPEGDKQRSAKLAEMAKMAEFRECAEAAKLQAAQETWREARADLTEVEYAPKKILERIDAYLRAYEKGEAEVEYVDPSMTPEMLTKVILDFAMFCQE